VASYIEDLPTTASVVRRNIVHGASGDGISVGPTGDFPVTNNLLAGNTAVGSGDDGIDVASPGTVLRDSRALGNSDHGIVAADGVIDGGDNVAAGNGSQQRCVGVECG
jgi:hypothetical protein